MLLWKLAFRNLLVHRLKTLVTGAIIIFGTTLAIVGNSVVDAVSGGMQRSLTNSLTGDIQVYAADAKEPIAVLGSTDGNLPDIGHVENFKKVKDALSKVPNVKHVVPMGISFAMFNPGNLLDLKLEELRAEYKALPRKPERITAIKAHLRAIIQDIERSQEESRELLGGIYGGEKLFAEAPATLARAKDPAFWNAFDANYEPSIEFLANKMAPLIFDDNQIFLNYFGTVPELFKEAFPGFEVAKGEMIPEGARGFLFSDYVYENQIKHRVARRLDHIHKQLTKEKAFIKGNKDLEDRIKANIDQAAEIYTQLEPPQAEALVPKLKSLLKSQETELPKLLGDFLKMNDANFMERFNFFYAEIAPHVLLYRVKVGDTFAITAFTKSGYSSSVNMKVYGTYRFKSFESSPLAGALSVMDMVSFRKLFGMMTSERREETEALDTEMGLGDLGRDDMEALFGGTGAENQAAEDAVKPASPPTASLKQITGGVFGQADSERRDLSQRYTRSEMEDGVFMNAAITLKNADKLGESMKAIRKVNDEQKLGLQITDWREAAGFIGQLTVLVRGVLYLFVGVIFGVATFIIMNSMLMAALERKREIGTMRAIGAHRSMILGLFLRETFVLSFVFGVLGTLIGVAIVLAVGTPGIPAMGDIATFFFSGPRLYLELNPMHIAIVFVCMTLVALVSTQYPAWRAMRISPLEAMQSSD
jgi:ABC-type lipoprotein release transport system permease subunit